MKHNEVGKSATAGCKNLGRDQCAGYSSTIQCSVLQCYSALIQCALCYSATVLHCSLQCYSATVLQFNAVCYSATTAQLQQLHNYSSTIQCSVLDTWTVLQYYSATVQCATVLQCYSSTIQRSAMVGREGTLIIAGDNLIVITIVTVPNHCHLHRPHFLHFIDESKRLR